MRSAASRFESGRIKINGSQCFGVLFAQHGQFWTYSIADNPQLRLLVGGGLFIGGKHQGIGIDGGLIFGQVDVKSNTVTADDVLPSDYGRLTVSKLDHAFFLSIGYMYKF